MDEEDDFITIQHAVRISRNSQGMVLKIRAFISIDSINEDVEPTQAPIGRPVLHLSKTMLICSPQQVSKGKFWQIREMIH